MGRYGTTRGPWRPSGFAKKRQPENAVGVRDHGLPGSVGALIGIYRMARSHAAGIQHDSIGALGTYQ